MVEHETNAISPVVSRSELIERVGGIRADGNTIILANGCFDLFHVGHLRYLQGAKELGGTLIVGINSDRQARLLKGEGRPYIPQHERAEIVASLKCVDLVTVFDEPTVEQLIYAVRPNIHAKGTDYTEQTVPERDIMEGIGGIVAIVGDAKEHSSTAILQEIGSRPSN